MNPEKAIGTIQSVNSSIVTALIREDCDTLTKSIDGVTFKVAQVGSYVMIPESGRLVIGMVNDAQIIDYIPSGEALPKKRKSIHVQLLGTVTDGRFERGLSVFPMVDGTVYMADQDDLAMIFSKFRIDDFSVGVISLFENERQYLEPNRFFGKHIAVLGSTGAGKSSLVASIFQKVQNLNDTHVIILDIHDEYSTAFEGVGNTLRINELELPFWLMNFEELEETFIDQSEESAHSQIMVFKDAILEAKKRANPLLRDALTVDTPAYFDLVEVRARVQALDRERIAGTGGVKEKEGPFYGQFTRFLVRLDSRLNDKRYEFIFKPKVFKTSETLKTMLTRIFGLDTKKKITVIDLSGVPFDVVNVIVSLLGRTIFDFNVWNRHRRDFPVMIVFEEAHNYLPSVASTSNRSAKKTVERIAKEGRKYGVGCMIVSQRPAEVSETILAQCNNFVTMRLTNPNDQNYVKKLVPDSLTSLIDILPSLRQGEALFLGDAAPLPVRVMLDFPNPAPNSSDIMFYERWKHREYETSVSDVVERWWRQERV
jgi:DNA helicase HerA-like ATPase